MNPATTQAQAMVEALIDGGVTDAVLAPGSRSAPLALTLAAAERGGRLRLHVRIDERSAGFLALGLAKRSRRPVPVVTTSGTAVANLLPAVVEASHAGVPLVVLSADRPPWLRGVGASQTVDQLKIFGEYPRLFAEVAVAGEGAGGPRYWRSLVGRALVRAADPTDPGPVHLNLPFAEPLVPDTPVGEPARGRAVPSSPLVQRLAGPAASPPLSQVVRRLGLQEVPARGLIVAGDPTPGLDPAAVVALADACGWPIIAEPTAGLHGAAAWVPAGALVAAGSAWVAEHAPDLVLTVGRVGLTRDQAALVRSARHHVAVDAGPRWADPTRTAELVVSGVPVADEQLPDVPQWRASWLAAGARAAEQVDAVLDAEAMFSGLHAARHVWRALAVDAQLFVAASWPIRQVQLTAQRRSGLRVLANRGANGIDGLIATAWGAAVAHAGPTVALLGDLAFLHDSNGLLAPDAEARPPLRIVVLDNDGGGIFSQLEQAAPRFAADFERVFGTPHGLHLVGRSRLSGIPGRGVDDLDTFVEAFADPPPGVSVLVAQVADRASEADLLARIRAEAIAAVGG
jgi:2-succinyl-5-enolpyruvyl-6-hydroxy-3-cyclohexene-1-carboxylate synthase